MSADDEAIEEDFYQQTIEASLRTKWSNLFMRLPRRSRSWFDWPVTSSGRGALWSLLSIVIQYKCKEAIIETFDDGFFA